MKIRTPESIRADAAEQFAWGVDYAAMRERNVAEARADQDLGLRMVEAALALPDGDIFNWSEHLPAEMSSKDKFHCAFRVLPFLSGALHLLEMEFAHATAGVVPTEAVRDLMAGAATFDFNGVELTAGNVVMQFRRKALAAG